MKWNERGETRVKRRWNVGETKVKRRWNEGETKTLTEPKRWNGKNFQRFQPRHDLCVSSITNYISWHVRVIRCNFNHANLLKFPSTFFHINLARCNAVFNERLSCLTTTVQRTSLYKDFSPPSQRHQESDLTFEPSPASQTFCVWTCRWWCLPRNPCRLSSSPSTSSS